jgi:hypothetical protein
VPLSGRGDELLANILPPGNFSSLIFFLKFHAIHSLIYSLPDNAFIVEKSLLHAALLHIYYAKAFRVIAGWVIAPHPLPC